MSESRKVWQVLKRTAPGDWYRLEVVNYFGFPDCLYNINGNVGLVELKWLPSWPSRSGTLTDLGVTPRQAEFMRGWCYQGGRGYILARIDNEWILVWGSDIGNMTREMWYNNCVWRGENLINFDFLKDIL